MTVVPCKALIRVVSRTDAVEILEYVDTMLDQPETRAAAEHGRLREL
jgi:hypothetical protein